MYIISKFKDYYDCVAGTVGIDKSIIYKRDQHIEVLNKKNTIELPALFNFSKYKHSWEHPLSKFNRINSFEFSNLSYKHKKENYNYFILGVCGKVYIGFNIFEDVDDKYSSKLIETTFDKQKVINILKDKRAVQNFNKLYTEVYNLVKKEIFHIHRKYNTPIFAYHSYYEIYDKVFIINPNLKEFQFYKIIEPFTLFQEIQMFISGVLGKPEKKSIEVSDETKIKSKGFDYKWSFRKEKK